MSLLLDLARLFRVEATHDPHAITKCARSVEHEVSPTDSERRHLLAEAKAIEEEAESGDAYGGCFSGLRGRIGG